jgi:hypothetical protein
VTRVILSKRAVIGKQASLLPVLSTLLPSRHGLANNIQLGRSRIIHFHFPKEPKVVEQIRLRLPKKIGPPSTGSLFHIPLVLTHPVIPVLVSDARPFSSSDTRTRGANASRATGENA